MWKIVNIRDTNSRYKQDWKYRPKEQFTHHRYMKPKSDVIHRQEYYDDDPCPFCKRQKDVLVHEMFPIICRSCYQLVRAYIALGTDPLRLQFKRVWEEEDIRRIYTYMEKYARDRRIPFRGLSSIILQQAGLKSDRIQ